MDDTDQLSLIYSKVFYLFYMRVKEGHGTQELKDNSLKMDQCLCIIFLYFWWEGLEL